MSLISAFEIGIWNAWIFMAYLLLLIVFMVGYAVFVNVEEQRCLGMWNDAYREYMNRTPRWIGIPK